MLGLMQGRPLLVSSLIEYAERYRPDGEIVSRMPDGPIHRASWGSVAARSRRLAGAVARLGIAPGDRVASFAWNHHRHLELFFGISGTGTVLHTVNPRLFPEQLRYIINHAENRALFFDLTFVPLVEQLAPHLPTVRHYIALCDRGDMPATAIPDLLCYEDLLADGDTNYDWPAFDENTASSLCYTSGTTGNPKGVLYSHRSTILHTMSLMAVDTMAISARDSILPCAPMFHVNCWGIPYAAAGTGAKLVLPGMKLDGESLYELMRDESVTFAGAVPTVWLNMFAWIEQNRDRIDLSSLCIERILSGGTAVPRIVIEKIRDYFGATTVHAWGMTELSPLGTIGTPLPRHETLDAEERMALQLKQGRAVYGIEMRVVDDAGRELPRDGTSVGLIQARGPWVLSGYFKGDGEPPGPDGWFGTGDVGTMDAEGFIQITDRAKDVVKSGGEWISSIDIENLAVSHPAVHEAAVIAARHPRWQERPLLLVQCKTGATVTRDDMLAFLAGRIARWWLPDDVVVLDSLPHTATGKVMKTKLREDYAGWLEKDQAG
ncbi:MAG: long-chain-fatty-acid--CoA ligase [Acetobacteraceae bacterium]